MSIEGIIASLLMFAAGGYWVLLPMLRQRSAVNRAYLEEQKHHDRLLNAYERVLATIRDMDEDFRTGKLPQAEYEQEREIWAARGVQLLAELDRLSSPAGIPTTEDRAQRDAILDEAIEAAIAGYVAASKR